MTLITDDERMLRWRAEHAERASAADLSQSELAGGVTMDEVVGPGAAQAFSWRSRHRHVRTRPVPWIGERAVGSRRVMSWLPHIWLDDTDSIIPDPAEARL